MLSLIFNLCNLIIVCAWYVFSGIFKALAALLKWIFAPRLRPETTEEDGEACDEWEEDDEDESLLALNLDREKRRLAALYDRRDKAEYLNNTSPAAWARYQNTKTWRGLLYDIEAAERKIRLLEGE